MEMTLVYCCHFRCIWGGSRWECKVMELSFNYVSFSDSSFGFWAIFEAVSLALVLLEDSVKSILRISIFLGLKILDYLIGFMDSRRKSWRNLYKFLRDSKRGDVYITSHKYFIRVFSWQYGIRRCRIVGWLGDRILLKGRTTLRSSSLYS